MNKKLILNLSLFGLFMAIATVFWIPWNIEPIIWFIIFIICAIQIAKKCSGKFFYTGFLLSLMNSVWMTVAHILFFNKYISSHPQELEIISKLPVPYSPRIAMIIVGPFFGVVFGIVLGIFCVIAGSIIKHRVD